MPIFGVGKPPVSAQDDLPQVLKEWFGKVSNYIKSQLTVVNTAVAYTVLSADAAVICDVTSAGFTVTLPLAASYPGREIVVKKKDASGNTLTVGRSGSDLIDGATTATTTTQYKAWAFKSDGISNWWII